MTMKTIPLVGGAVNSHQVFSAQLGDSLIEFTVNYVQRGQWSVDLRKADTLIAAGLMLEPNANIIQSLNLGLGQLIFVGDEPTLDNLGRSNSLNWVAPDE